MRAFEDPIKVGSTVQADAMLCSLDGAGHEVPVDLTGWSITSQVRATGPENTLLAQVVVTPYDQVSRRGEYAVRFSTAGMPRGVVLWDVRYEYDSTVLFTETVELELELPVTQP